jgi:hypothetical protein
VSEPTATSSSCTPHTIDAIARRVAEILRNGPGPCAEGSSYFGNDGGRLVDAAELASFLGAEREWVYAHAAELGR